MTNEEIYNQHHERMKNVEVIDPDTGQKTNGEACICSFCMAHRLSTLRELKRCYETLDNATQVMFNIDWLTAVIDASHKARIGT